MSTANAFSVFPPPRVPRISVPSPSNRKPSLKTVGQVEDGKSTVVTVEELQASETPQTGKTFVYSSPTLGTQANASPMFKNGKIPPPPPRPSSLVASNYTNTTGISSSAHGSPEPESISSAETLVQPPTRGEYVVPIKSIFPVYDPSLPLSQQGLYPPRPSSIYDPRQYASDNSLMNARSHLAPAVRSSYMPRANQDSIVEVPLDTLDLQDPTFSTSKELEKLWDATSSSSPLDEFASFDLELTRLEEATFALGSAPDAPFYSITTYDTAEISVTKTCPRKRTVTCDVVLASVEASSRRMPPNDGLVSLVLPKMAAMLAITQTDKLTEAYDLPSDDREELLEAAMKRATDQEASHLRWNPMDSRYELEHPAVSRKNRETNFVMSPLSPQGVKKPAIHITVATSDVDRPVILVTCPGSARPAPSTTEAGNDNISSAADIQLASLDFNSKTLHIEANAILEVMPSLFAIDSIITAIAIVSVADEHTNTVMGGMPVWTSKANKANRASMFEPASPPINGTFFATIAEREEAEEEARTAAKNHKKDKKKAKAAKFMNVEEQELDLEAGRTWYGKSKAKKSKKKQIVISEFDLDKLTHYQSGARQGQELPAVTRGMLSVMSPFKMRLKAFRKHDK